MKQNLHTEMKAYEAQRIRDALIMHSWNKIETAKYLGIGLSSLYRKIIELGISKRKKK